MAEKRNEAGEVAGQLASSSDGDLAVRAASGDRSAAAELITRYHESVRRFLRRLTGREDLADDLAQDTFVRMLRYAHRYDPKYPMRTWLLVIARRLSIRQGQRLKRQVTVDEWHQADESSPDPMALAGSRDDHEMLRRKLQAAIEKLTDPQRQAVVLFHQQGLSVQEVAEVMKVPVGTVKSHLHRGRATMRKILGGDPEVMNR